MSDIYFWGYFDGALVALITIMALTLGDVMKELE